jgi:hypothetical protein
MTMHHIASQTLANSTTQFLDFSSIPQTFTHLQLRCSVRATAPNPSDYFAIYISSTQAGHTLYGDGATAAASGAINSFGYGISQIPASTATANVFASSIIDLLDYRNTSKTKTYRSITGYDVNGAGYVALSSTFDPSFTSALSQITIFAGSAFVTGTRFDLYGITDNPIATGA